jgi:hypothetical protein
MHWLQGAFVGQMVMVVGLTAARVHPQGTTTKSNVMWQL